MLISELGNSGVVYLPPKTPRYSIYVVPLYSPSYQVFSVMFPELFLEDLWTIQKH